MLDALSSLVYPEHETVLYINSLAVACWAEEHLKKCASFNIYLQEEKNFIFSTNTLLSPQGEQCFFFPSSSPTFWKYERYPSLMIPICFNTRYAYFVGNSLLIKFFSTAKTTCCLLPAASGLVPTVSYLLNKGWRSCNANLFCPTKSDRAFACMLFSAAVNMLIISNTNNINHKNLILYHRNFQRMCDSQQCLHETIKHNRI